MTPYGYRLSHTQLKLGIFCSLKTSYDGRCRSNFDYQKSCTFRPEPLLLNLAEFRIAVVQQITFSDLFRSPFFKSNAFECFRKLPNLLKRRPQFGWADALQTIGTLHDTFSGKASCPKVRLGKQNDLHLRLNYGRSARTPLDYR